MKRLMILLLNLVSVGVYADSVNVVRTSPNLSTGKVTAIIMHMTTTPVDPTLFSPSCFPATSTYNEALLDVTAVGGYGHANSATILYRCLRSGTKASMPSYPSWQTNPNNSQEKITTSFDNYGAFYATLKKTTFRIPCSMSVSGGNQPGSYSYSGYGMDLQYNDVYGTTQSLGVGSPGGGNCSTSMVSLSAAIPPGWIGIQLREYVGAGGTTINCTSSGYLPYFLQGNGGQTCTVYPSSPYGNKDDNHVDSDQCKINVYCS